MLKAALMTKAVLKDAVPGRAFLNKAGCCRRARSPLHDRARRRVMAHLAGAFLVAGGAVQAQNEAGVEHKDMAPVPEPFLFCTSCHGAGLAGNPAVGAPAIAGLPAWYVREQLRAFRSGSRGSQPDDGIGAAMRAAAGLLPDEDAVYAVAEYVAALTPGPADLTTKPEDPIMKTRNPVSLTGLAGGAALALAVGASTSAAAEVRRHKLPDSDFPIAQAVEVLPGTTLVYHSGMTPRPADPEAEQYSPEYWGDTEAQTLSVFRRLEDSLTAKGLTFDDVIKMQVFLVAPEAGGMMDFAGMMRAYRRYFGTEEQPNLPARSALQVAGLAVPGMLVEIEVVLARP